MAKAMAADAEVGFWVPPASAGLPQAMTNLGQGNVSAVWAYQGSKPFVYRRRLYSAMGDTLPCVDPKTEKVVWKRTIRPNSAERENKLVDHLMTPPALINDKVVLGTTFGEVLCLSAQSGEVLWTVTSLSCPRISTTLSQLSLSTASRSGGLLLPVFLEKLRVTNRNSIKYREP